MNQITNLHNTIIVDCLKWTLTAMWCYTLLLRPQAMFEQWPNIEPCSCVLLWDCWKIFLVVALFYIQQNRTEQCKVSEQLLNLKYFLFSYMPNNRGLFMQSVEYNVLCYSNSPSGSGRKHKYIFFIYIFSYKIQNGSPIPSHNWRISVFFAAFNTNINI